MSKAVVLYCIDNNQASIDNDYNASIDSA